MGTYTLDTNCLIDVEEDRPAGQYVKMMLYRSSASEIDLALVASSASERQQAGGFSDHYSNFDVRRKQLGFGQLVVLKPIARKDVNFFDHSLISGTDLDIREEDNFKTFSQIMSTTGPFVLRTQISI
jgi:hypothetical protein